MTETADRLAAAATLLGASPAAVAGLLTKQGVDGTYLARRNGHIEQHRRALAALFRRQQQSSAVRVAAGLSAFNPREWDDQLAEVIFSRNRAVAREFATLVAGFLDGTVDLGRLDAFLRVNAAAAATNINDSTAEGVRRALAADDEDAVPAFWTGMAVTHAAVYARSMVTTAANFGATDGARAAGAATKTWEVNSGNPRSIHAMMAGETVPIDETFSNGMSWPGDPAGGAENNANCACSVSFSRERGD